MSYDFENGRQTAAPRSRIGGLAEPWPRHDEVAGQGLSRSIPVHPDWAGLRARFLAIHALQRTLAAVGPIALPAGSFAEAAEAVLNSCRKDMDAVNPVYWANGKSASLITGPVAGHPTPDDRGLQ